MCEICDGTGLDPLDGDECACLESYLDDMVGAFLRALHWSEPELPDDPDDTDGPVWAPEALAEIRTYCAEFLCGELDAIQEEHGALDEFGDGIERFASDFCLTANRHGCGFWDGDWPTHGDRLTRKCQPYSFEPYIGDDGLIYLV